MICWHVRCIVACLLFGQLCLARETIHPPVLTLENQRIAVTIDRATGAIRSIRDKEQGVAYPFSGIGFALTTETGVSRAENLVAVKTRDDGVDLHFACGRLNTAQSTFDFAGVKAGIAVPILGQHGTLFVGDLDDLRIYDKALKNEEIQAMYPSELLTRAGELSAATITNGTDWFDVEGRRIVAHDKQIRSIVQQGDQYRHAHPTDSPTPSLTYVSPDKTRALVLAYQTAPAEQAVCMQAPVSGLDPARIYSLSEINLPQGDAHPRIAPGSPPAQTGAAWTASGIPLIFRRQYDSAALVLNSEADLSGHRSS